MKSITKLTVTADITVNYKTGAVLLQEGDDRRMLNVFIKQHFMN